MSKRLQALLSVFVVGLIGATSLVGQEKEKLFKEPINVNIPHISTDKSVKYDYDIVYVRAKRAGDKIHKRYYTDIASPIFLEAGADLMLLHPDGSEELLVEGGEGAITDPVVSFDSEWVIYTKIHTVKGAGQFSPPSKGADIYKLHLKTRKIIQLTTQEFTPNTGAANWSSDCRKNEPGKNYLNYGVFNMGAFPLPGGKIVFTSNRNAYRPSRGYPQVALQLFVMDDDGKNIEQIGYLNIAGALHPVTMMDGRIMFSSLESQGIRGDILWGIWTINPDGTGWNPLISAFDPGGAPNAFHFQTQLSDGSLVIEFYYNQNNSGFGSYIKLPASPPDDYPAFGPAHMRDKSHKPWRFGRFDNGKGKHYTMPFMPRNAISLTPFSRVEDGPADHAIIGDKTSVGVGKFTHPSGAPDNHLLTIYSPGPVNHQYTYLPQLDGGIYLLKKGEPIEEPSQLLLIKNDPNYNEQWPRAIVPYERIYGMKEPKIIPPLANDGNKSPLLQEGTPFGLVGTSSLYKRESYPNGVVPKDKVTAAYAGGNDPWKGLDAFTSHGNGMPLNWHNQGADAGLYDNEDIFAIRILVQEPTTDRKGGPKAGKLFYSHAQERLRILGEFPVRHFGEPGASSPGGQPLDPDGNPDTSFMAKIPANTSFTFQTLDKDGMVLNMAQTWHQLKPGEVRNDCGGCHSHSQKPTEFKLTAAAKSDYKVWDLVNQTPVLTTKAKDESKKQWNAADDGGIKLLKKGPLNVEYFRDVQPILKKSCVACHTSKEGATPAGKLDLDADHESINHEHHGKFPGTYYRLALDGKAKFGHKPVGYDSWGYPQASRYVRMMQSRRSLLVWNIYGKRLDGFHNDDHPSEPFPGAGTLVHKGKEVDAKKNGHKLDIDYYGHVMPPPDAVKGTYKSKDGKTIKVAALTDEDKKTIVRWIDLGCPIDLDFDPAHPDMFGYGWMCDDNRPILALTHPAAGKNKQLSRLLVGMHDYYTGLDMDTFTVTADFAINDKKAGSELAGDFKLKSQGVWELVLTQPITELKRGTIVVAVKDKAGNISKIEQAFSVGAK